jgi:toxin ParE1/3/4
MPSVVRRPRASADLSEIWEFIAEEIGMERADEFIDRIDGKFRVLAAQPRMGRERGDLAPGLRSLPMPPYVIFYQPVLDGVEIVRVLHGARDAGAQFEGS